MRFFYPAQALARVIRHAAPHHHPNTLLRAVHHHDLEPPLRAVINTLFQDGHHEALRRHYNSQVHREKIEEHAEPTQASSSSSSTSSVASSQQQHGGSGNQAVQSHRRGGGHHLSRRGSRHGHNNLLKSLLHDPFFDPLFSFAPASLLNGSNNLVPSEMNIDIFSTPSTYTIEASLPGVPKENIKLTVEDNQLTIEAERRVERRSPSTAVHAEESAHSSSSAVAPGKIPESQPASHATTQAADTQVEGEEHQVEYMESSYGRVTRTISLPEDIELDKLSAKSENGVLKIELPRVSPQVKASQRKIQIQ